MSNGREKEPNATVSNVVTLDQNEFNKVCRRVHTQLVKKVERAQMRKEKKPSTKTNKDHIEASKDVFVFVHLLELVESMADEISDLRNTVEHMSNDKHPSSNRIKGWSEMYFVDKKHFPN